MTFVDFFQIEERCNLKFGVLNFDALSSRPCPSGIWTQRWQWSIRWSRTRMAFITGSVGSQTPAYQISRHGIHVQYICNLLRVSLTSDKVTSQSMSYRDVEKYLNIVNRVNILHCVQHHFPHLSRAVKALIMAKIKITTDIKGCSLNGR